MSFKTLDVGCGYSKSHIKKGEIGIDLEKGLCDVQASTYYLPFRNQSFQKVVMSHILEHLTNISRVFEEIKGVLDRNGIVEVEVPNPHAFWVFKDIILHRKLLEDKTHVSSFNENQLVNLLAQLGFTTQSISYVDTSWTKKRSFIHSFFYKLLFFVFPNFDKAIKVTAIKEES